MIRLRGIDLADLRSVASHTDFVTLNIQGSVCCALEFECVKKIWRRFNSGQEKGARNPSYRKLPLSGFNMHHDQLVKTQMTKDEASCTSFIGKKDLHVVWKKKSALYAELFADPFLNSGVCQQY